MRIKEGHVVVNSTDPKEGDFQFGYPYSILHAQPFVCKLFQGEIYKCGRIICFSAGAFFLYLGKRASIKAIAFDAFPIFDPRPIFKNLVDRFPVKGKQLGDVWRTKQFGYQWLRTCGGKYKNFLGSDEGCVGVCGGGIKSFTVGR